MRKKKGGIKMNKVTMTAAGLLAGMVVGGSMVFVWKYLVAPMGGVFAIYELLPAFLIGGAALVIVSLLTPAPEAEVLEDFEYCAK